MDIKKLIADTSGLTASSLRWFGLGAWLLLLFYICAAFVLMSLSAHQLQHRIQQIQINKQTVSVSKIRNFRKEWVRIETYTANANENYIQAKALWEDVEPTYNKLIIELGSKPQDGDARLVEKNKLYNHFCKFVDSQNQLNARLLRDVVQKNKIINSYGFGAYVAQPSAQKSVPAKTTAQPCVFIVYSNSDFEASLFINEDINGILDSFDYFKTLQKPDSTNPLTPDAALSPKTKSGFFSFGYLKIWKLISFIDMPSEMLTVTVVFFMGALGGTIRLTRNYLKHDSNESYADYMFFPILGGMTGFAIYVLAKAGVLIISDSGQDGGNLSPYFISFIGIMSGMLADDALNTIQKVGGNWFKQSTDDLTRWGVDLENAFKAKKVTLNDIANLVHCPEDTVAKWIAEEEPVPMHAQKLIAAWLQTHPRKLFSDVPPSG